ncbi:3,4-dihydroxy-2-butanone-4-phosphate synthase [Caryophanon latum]|uniref:3,4-dihydroxy-2-butanone 4-phosphate synthase n=1 Tax=Caryophanon latum TaxID=33977 RepID=A0A1C0YTH1_9BACL|nr:3,4-dihydroxy-2-butanone-4-phosphate synthase [Caryophanon latum]OCS90439.1 3,4-dihydroxy-2-butanone-4-phosphate synthase [Caryophanon latum]
MVEVALQHLKAGRIIIVVDDEDRENEGDFVCLAEHATPENINFMAVHGRGLICAPIDEAIAERLQLAPMVRHNTDPHGTAFTESVDFETTTTGISAFERAETIQRLCDPTTTPQQFKRPGHMFPLLAKRGGVLERRGHTEAGVELAKLCGSAPAAVICEILNLDGTMARRPQLEIVAAQHGMIILTIEQLVAHMQLVHN